MVLSLLLVLSLSRYYITSSAVAHLRHLVLLETCTRSHLSYAREHTVWRLLLVQRQKYLACAVDWIHHHLCPSSELLSVWLQDSAPKQTNLKLPGHQSQVSFWKWGVWCLSCIPPALDGHLTLFWSSFKSLCRRSPNAGKKGVIARSWSAWGQKEILPLPSHKGTAQTCKTQIHKTLLSSKMFSLPGICSLCIPHMFAFGLFFK